MKVPGASKIVQLSKPGKSRKKVSGPKTFYDIPEQPGPKPKKIHPSKSHLSTQKQRVHNEVMKLAQGHVALVNAFPDDINCPGIGEEFVANMFSKAIESIISSTSRQHGERQLYKDIHHEYFEGDVTFKEEFDKLTKEACANLHTAMRGGALVAVQADIDYGLGPFVASGDQDGLKARAAWLLDGKRYLYRDLDAKQDPFCRDSVMTFAVAFVASWDSHYGLRAQIMDKEKGLNDVHDIITANFIALLFTAIEWVIISAASDLDENGKKDKGTNFMACTFAATHAAHLATLVQMGGPSRLVLLRLKIRIFRACRAVKSVVAKKVPPIIIDPEDAAVQAAELCAKMELDAAALDDPELAALLEQENSRFRSLGAGSTSSCTTLQQRQGSPSSSTRQTGSFDSHNRVDHSGSNNFASGSNS